jgi:hypothetical protein
VKKLVTFVAAVFRIAKMSFTMLAAVFGCVRINHTMSAMKRNPMILRTANHRSAPVARTLTAYLYRMERIGGIQRAGRDGRASAVVGAPRTGGTRPIGRRRRGRAESDRCDALPCVPTGDRLGFDPDGTSPISQASLWCGGRTIR